MVVRMGPARMQVRWVQGAKSAFILPLNSQFEEQNQWNANQVEEEEEEEAQENLLCPLKWSWYHLAPVTWLTARRRVHALASQRGFMTRCDWAQRCVHESCTTVYQAADLLKLVLSHAHTRTRADAGLSDCQLNSNYFLILVIYSNTG